MKTLKGSIALKEWGLAIESIGSALAMSQTELSEIMKISRSTLIRGRELNKPPTANVLNALQAIQIIGINEYKELKSEERELKCREIERLNKLNPELKADPGDLDKLLNDPTVTELSRAALIIGVSTLSINKEIGIKPAISKYVIAGAVAGAGVGLAALIIPTLGGLGLFKSLKKMLED